MSTMRKRSQMGVSGETVSRFCMMCGNENNAPLILSFGCSHAWCHPCSQIYKDMSRCVPCNQDRRNDTLIHDADGSCHYVITEKNGVRRFCKKSGAGVSPAGSVLDRVEAGLVFCSKHRDNADAPSIPWPRVPQSVDPSSSGAGPAHPVADTNSGMLEALQRQCLELTAQIAQMRVESSTQQIATATQPHNAAMPLSSDAWGAGTDSLVESVDHMFRCTIAERGKQLLQELGHRLQQRPQQSSMTQSQRLIHHGVTGWGLAELPQLR